MASWIRNCTLLTVLFQMTVWRCDSAKILGIFPFENWSHTQFFLPLMKELASRGHQMTVISHMEASNTPIPNYTEVSLHGLLPLCGNITIDYVINMNILEAVFQDILDIGVTSCETLLNSDVIKRFNQSDDQFDAVIVEMFNTDCYVPFAHRFNAPLITISSSAPYPWYSDRMGMDNNPAFVSTLLLPFGQVMTFWERLGNVAFLLIGQLAYKLYYLPKAEVIARKFFGPDMPPLKELVQDTSLYISNTHPSFTGVRSLPPNVIEVAGLNLKSQRKLPKELEEFITSAKHGVIYFSLGSILDGSSFQPEKKRALIDAFASLPQKVLWRCDEDNTTALIPPNVKTMRWLPQLDILSHPNTKLFITHGGLLSITEAMSTGTPILGMPFFAEQSGNVKSIEEAGAGLLLQYNDLNKEHLVNLISTILNDKRYTKRAKVVSNLFHDRPLSAMDTAIYWIEYTIRHKGAPHLRTQAVNMPWYKHYLLDVLLFMTSLIVIILNVIRIILRFLLNWVRKATRRKQKIS